MFFDATKSGERRQGETRSCSVIVGHRRLSSIIDPYRGLVSSCWGPPTSNSRFLPKARGERKLASTSSVQVAALDSDSTVEAGS